MNLTWMNEAKQRRLIREAYFGRRMRPEREEVENDVFFFDFATGRIREETLVQAWDAIENHFNSRKAKRR